ncbi:hypothetical protein H7U32_06140 [Bifidobacterium pullorum subsp. saeculare]|uniref:Uncharacterized protein n=1 Tax=Bifidobacterium pullorum subsp. saeculare TaxID=78257 RepID=A0A938WYA1_9BIFI|nr:hypothetical protein [Bifidobacterium pullorum]MBM6699892.1 hypothetical protein [Bifidobacterium pullorum subsp. saeculare]
MNGKDNPWKNVAGVYYHVDCLSDVAPGDVVYLSNAGGSLMVAYKVGSVVRCNGLTHLYVSGLTGRKYTIGGASTMRFHEARRPVADKVGEK